MSFLLCLCVLFNKIRDKGRTGSAWKQGGWGEGGRGENDPNNACRCEYTIKKKAYNYNKKQQVQQQQKVHSAW
jgi:hypothetical protein